MQSVSSWIWTRVAVSISNDDKHYTSTCYTVNSSLCQTEWHISLLNEDHCDDTILRAGNAFVWLSIHFHSLGKRLGSKQIRNFCFALISLSICSIHQDVQTSGIIYVCVQIYAAYILLLHRKIHWYELSFKKLSIYQRIKLDRLLKISFCCIFIGKYEVTNQRVRQIN